MSNERVTLVIPGRNCAATCRACLAAVVPLLEDSQSRLDEIIFVDDGSTDETAKHVAAFPIRVISGNGAGPGAARNVGWREAKNPLVWFVDADCVAESDALDLLLKQMDDPRVGGASGSYGIMNPQSLLARLIHEEIIERHRQMPRDVNFMATFNVLYRREILESLGGFNERYLKAQDAEFSFRVTEAGHRLRFDMNSRVKHFHATRLRAYLRTQRQQGFWRFSLHMAHRGHVTRSHYSSLLDHVQPPLALVLLASLPCLLWSAWRWIPAVLTLLLLAAQLPITARLLRRLRSPEYALFVLLSSIRAIWRGIGLAHGAIVHTASRGRGAT